MRAFLAAALAAGATVLLVGQSRGVPDPRPLPDPEAFVREVRARLQPDDDRQRDYAYTETRRQVQLDGAGRATSESVKVIESYPGFPGERRWDRLVSENGRPVPADELARVDRKRAERAQELARQLARQTPADRARLDGERERRRRESTRMVDDAFRVFEFHLTGREVIDGHGAIVITMAPRRDAQTETRIGGMLRHFQGHAWVSETEYELIRLEVEALDDLSMGFGLLARVHQGSRFAFERRKVGGVVWLPARASYAASARVMLLRAMRVGGTSEFSNYRKFSVDTEATYGGASPDGGGASR